MDRITDTGTINFQLSQVDTAFASRSYDVFSCLDGIEANHKAFEKNHFDNHSDLLKPDPSEEPIAPKTNFKIPKGVPWKSRLPDYRLRPKKWKTYSLLDISPEQMSDTSNQRTALEFIDSLRNRSTESCPDATNQMDIDCMDTSTDEEVGQSCFSSHKQHVFRKPAVQSVKQPKLKEDQLACKASAQMVDVGPNLWTQQIKDENEEASSEDANSNLSIDADGCFDDTLHLSTKTESADVHFQIKGLKVKSKHIRPRIRTEDNEDENSDGVALKDECVLETKHMDAEINDDESDEFSDCAVEDSVGDEELPSGLAETEHDVNNWSDLQPEEQESSSDEDLQPEEFAFIDSLNSDSFMLAQEDIKSQILKKDGYCIDDLDTVD